MNTTSRVETERANDDEMTKNELWKKAKQDKRSTPSRRAPGWTLRRQLIRIPGEKVAVYTRTVSFAR